jgi:hypothetical protein
MLATLGSHLTERHFRRLRFWAFAILGVVAGHDLVFQIEYGQLSGRAMAVTGHTYWALFAVLALAASAVPIAAIARGLLRLERTLRGIERVASSPADGRWTANADSAARAERTPSARAWAREFASLAPRLTLAIVIGFAIQENYEYVAAGHAAPGLWVLSWPLHPLALPILLATSLLLAAVGSWVRWRGAVLASRIAAARIRAALARVRPSAAPAAWGAIAALVAHRWILARRLAGRAPPVQLAA